MENQQVPTNEQKVSLLKKYFDQVIPLDKVELESGEKLSGVAFFKIIKDGKQKIIGLTDELCHWIINYSNTNKQLEKETLGMYGDIFNEPDDVQIFFGTGNKIYKFYKALAYYESIRQ